MAIKNFRPLTPGRRFFQVSDFAEITEKRSNKALTSSVSKTGGRNSYGRITSRHKGGGHKRQYRLIDFIRSKQEVTGKVVSIEYDPNRSARIALVNYRDGDKKYILAPLGLQVGDVIGSGKDVEIRPGNTLPLKHIPFGTFIHNIEMNINGGAKLVRSAGTFAEIMARDGEYAHVRLPSGEVRLIHVDCKATIGQLGNTEHNSLSIGKAGRKRWMGKRPHVRGVAMNPIDHPHGGGEGKTSGGRHPVTPWGVPTKGYKTRHNKRTDKFIIKRKRDK